MGMHFCFRLILISISFGGGIDTVKQKIFTLNQLDFESKIISNNSQKLKVPKAKKRFQIFQLSETTPPNLSIIFGPYLT